jgi:hypothetical protein
VAKIGILVETEPEAGEQSYRNQVSKGEILADRLRELK